MRIEAGVVDMVRRIEDDQTQVGYSVVGRSGGRVMPCAIRIIHVEEMRSVIHHVRSTSYMSKPVSMVC
jgi:hypothetical protein